MPKPVPLSASVNTETLSITVTGAPGGAGVFVLYKTASSSLNLTNSSIGAGLEYRVNSDAWIKLARNESVDLSINMAVDTLALRRCAHDGGVCQATLKIESVPTLRVGNSLVPVLKMDGGKVKGIALPSGGQYSLGWNTPLPKKCWLGDSTFANMDSFTGSPESLADNGDGTAKLTYPVANPASLGIAAGDFIGVQGCLDSEFEAYETPVVSVAAVNNKTVITYALQPNARPRNAVDGSPSIVVRYCTRAAGAGPATWFQALTGHAFKSFNFGQQGDTTTQILGRLRTEVLPMLDGGDVIFTGGINDVDAGIDLAVMMANVKAMYAEVCAAGGNFIIVTPLPQKSTRPRWNPAKMQKMSDWRNALRDFALENGIVCFDWGQCAAGSMQVIDATSATGEPIADVIGGDNIHESNAGAYLLGATMARYFNKIFGTGPNFAIARDLPSCGAFTNGLFLGNTGTAGAGVSGIVPTGMGVTVSAGTAVCSLTPRTAAIDGDFAGNWFTLTFNPLAAGDTMTIKFPNLGLVNGLLANGDIWRVDGLVQLFSGPDVAKALEMYVVAQTAKNIVANLTHAFMQLATVQMSKFPEPFLAKYGVQANIRASTAAGDVPSNFITSITLTAAKAGAVTIGLACWRAMKKVP